MPIDKKALIKSAYLHFRDGQWDHAIEQYRKLLELDPADILALNMLGDVFSRKGRVTEALQYYRQVLKIFKQQGAKDKVLIIQKKMSKLDPNSVEEEPAEVQSAPAAGGEAAGYDDAIDTLKSKVAGNPKSLELQQKLAELLMQAGRTQEAAETVLAIANALYNARQFQKASGLFQEVIKLDPGNLQAHIALGEISSKLGSDSEAKKEFLFVAENLIRQGSLDRGQLFAQKAIQLKSIEAHYYLGLVYYLKNQMNEAQTEFETLLKFKVNHQGALTHLAQIFTGAGAVDEAYALYERLLKADAKNAEALEKMAELDLQQGKSAEAAAKFAQAMDAFAAEEQWERAATCASQAVKLESQKPELYLKLADAAYNAGLEQQAAEACLGLAALYDSQGKAEEAYQMRLKASELTGEPPPTPPPKKAAAPAGGGTSKTKDRPLTPAEETKVMMNIAATYIRQGSLDEAIEIYQKILKTDPHNQDVKNALTRAYAMFAGVNPEAAVGKKAAPAPAGGEDEQKVQREARERAQREAQVRAQRSATPADKGAAAKAQAQDDLMQSLGGEQEDQIVGDHQDEFMTVTVAEIYTKQGLLNEALKIYQKILEIEPGNLEAQAKKNELEATLQEQENLRRHTEEAARSKKDKDEKPDAAKGAGPDAPKKSAPPKGGKGKDDDEPPGKGRRSRVSYV